MSACRGASNVEEIGKRRPNRIAELSSPRFVGVQAAQLHVLVSPDKFGGLSNGGRSFLTKLRQVMSELLDQENVVVNKHALDAADACVSEQVKWRAPQQAALGQDAQYGPPHRAESDLAAHPGPAQGRWMQIERDTLGARDLLGDGLLLRGVGEQPGDLVFVLVGHESVQAPGNRAAKGRVVADEPLGLGNRFHDVDKPASRVGSGVRTQLSRANTGEPASLAG